MKSRVFIRQRPRRLRASESIRQMASETQLSTADLVYPMFVTEGSRIEEPILSLPGQSKLSPDKLLDQAKAAYDLGIPAIALFPSIEKSKKDSLANEALNPKGLIPETIKMLKREIPQLTVITDVAMDPYSSDGHDGIVKDGKILNDDTLRVLAGQAIIQAEAGADFVAPSDMMDGRVAYIREALDQKSLTETGIIAYSAKYASNFYGPFRDALDSSPGFGDKKTYQMNPGNFREAIREAQMDIGEGADMIMVKPALSYLDIISKIRNISLIPVCAYNVSGEYAMVKAAAEKNWLEADKIMEEILLSIRRAGADIIFTYHAMEMAQKLNRR